MSWALADCGIAGLVFAVIIGIWLVKLAFRVGKRIEPTVDAQPTAWDPTKEELPPAPPDAVPEPIHAAWLPNAGRRILLAVESKTLRQATQLVLEPEGYQLLPAATVQEAMAALGLGRPDVVLVDDHLPGLERTAEELRWKLDTIPVLLLAGPETGPGLARRLQAVALRKPFESQVLVDTLSSMLPPAESQPRDVGVCAHCGDDIEGDAVRCARCGSVHHPECFKLMDGCARCPKELRGV